MFLPTQVFLTLIITQLRLGQRIRGLIRGCETGSDHRERKTGPDLDRNPACDNVRIKLILLHTV